ncbi:class I SAM-dependent methyltransferase [Mollicutes bacterium LVI A0039]|nr:class I SAM-dependent methyltransferase [Mollicutes bacterium LVI A0039]
MKNYSYLEDMETYAKVHDVPIIEREGLDIVVEIIKQNKVNSIFEVGSAIGYSASQFHIQTGASVTSIERDEQMYKLAVANVEKLDLNASVKLICDDALLYDSSNLGMFDCLYIDGAKSQYLKFLNKYITHLKPGGVVIFDNLLFHGYVFSDTVNTKSRNLKQLVRKLENFIATMQNSEEYSFELIEQGDGIGVLYRKGEEHE